MTRKEQRAQRLMPGGMPRYVRVYDNGVGDRYTVCFTKKPILRHPQLGTSFMFLGMNENPSHPQGIGQHGEAPQPIDLNKRGFAPAMGRRCHLGKRIPFTELPDECQRVVLSDYVSLWNLTND